MYYVEKSRYIPIIYLLFCLMIDLLFSFQNNDKTATAVYIFNEYLPSLQDEYLFNNRQTKTVFSSL